MYHKTVAKTSLFCKHCWGSINVASWLASVVETDREGNISPTGEKYTAYYCECSKCGFRYTLKELGLEEANYGE